MDVDADIFASQGLRVVVPPFCQCQTRKDLFVLEQLPGSQFHRLHHKTFQGQSSLAFCLQLQGHWPLWFFVWVPNLPIDRIGSAERFEASMKKRKPSTTRRAASLTAFV